MKEVVIKELKEGMNELLIHARHYILIAEEIKVTDEQWFINWEVELSQLATKDHNV